jgi:hypothetical protein
MCFSLVQCPEIKVRHYNLQSKYTDNNVEVYTTTMQPKLFVIHLLPVGVMILSLIIFSQILTAAAAEQTDIELKEDKDIKQELGLSKTKPTNEENNTVKRAKEEEEQGSNEDTKERGLVHNITIGNDIYASDVIPFKLPFDNIVLFP